MQLDKFLNLIMTRGCLQLRAQVQSSESDYSSYKNSMSLGTCVHVISVLTLPSRSTNIYATSLFILSGFLGMSTITECSQNARNAGIQSPALCPLD